MPSELLETASKEARLKSGYRPRFDRMDAVLILSLAGVLVAMHLVMPGPIPSGADGGNWIAIARGRAGIDVMASEVVYPPAFPGLLALLLPLAGPVPSLVALAVFSKVLLIGAIYLCVRPLGRWYAVASAVICGAAGAQLEAYAWGGYPQLMGTAFALLAVFYVVRSVSDRHSLAFVAGLICAGLTFASHALVSGLLLVALPLAVLHGLVLLRAGRLQWIRAALLVLAVVLPGVVYALVTTIRGADAGVTAVLTPYEVSRWESLWLAARDALLPWIVLVVVGVAGLISSRGHSELATTTAVGSSWSVASFAFFLATGEARALLLTQVGLTILACVAVRRILDVVRGSRSQNVSPMGRLAFPLTATLMVSMMTAIVVGGVASYSTAITWYRVADAEVLEGLDWLNENSVSSQLSATSAGPNGNPLGWWVQGYGERRTLTGIDPRALSFPDERTQADIANRIFDLSTTETEARALITSNGIDFLIVDKRGKNANWLKGEVASKLAQVYESPSIAILETS